MSYEYRIAAGYFNPYAYAYANTIPMPMLNSANRAPPSAEKRLPVCPMFSDIERSQS